MTTESPVFRVATEADREAIRRLHALTELWPDGEGELSDEYPEVAIALEPDFTGRGLGRELMARALDFARDRGAPGVSLTVDGANERAYRSYLAVGFEFVAAIPETEAAGYRTMLYRF